MIQFLETTVNSAGSMITLVLAMLIVIVFFYLILYLPQKRQEKRTPRCAIRSMLGMRSPPLAV